MALSQQQCQAFNDSLGRRPYDWDSKISKDRKPSSYLYTGMYRTETFPTFEGTTHLHERVYVTRPNDPGMWSQFIADPCVGNPCDTGRRYVGHGIDQLRYDRYRTDYQTPVFCIDQLDTIEQGIAKMAAIAEGYKDVPEMVCSDFWRQLVLRKAGLASQGVGLFGAGLADSSGNPISIDVTDNMFSISQGQSLVGSTNSLLINLNANGQLNGPNLNTTTLFSAALGQLTMEYLGNIQPDLAANGYMDKEWLPPGKFSITCDQGTRRRLMVANPALTGMYQSADFAKGGDFYSYGVTAGCGDWLFKEDLEQMRFRFRADMDGKDFNGNVLANAVWIEQVWPFENVAATFGKKTQYSNAWKIAPIALYHAYNRDARITYVGDIASVNDDMKFGLARSYMGKWQWYSPDVIITTDPNTGSSCTINNDKHNKGYWMGEYDLAVKTIYPEIERLIIGLREPQPYVRVPNTVTPQSAPSSSSAYQQLTSYNAACGSYVNPGFILPIED